MPKHIGLSTASLILLLLVSSFGCDQRDASRKGSAAAAAANFALGPAASAAKPTLDLGWCGGHGVPESVCTRCNDGLIETFKKAGDWCKEHGLPESQCVKCHPKVAALWAELKPKTPGATEDHAAPARTSVADSSVALLGPDTSPIKPVLDKGWCAGHGVPESVCTRCDDSLIETFKAAGDWCADHGLPETQCVDCHPEVAKRWEALNPDRKNTVTPASEAPASRPGATSDVIPAERWCFDHGVTKDVCTRCDPLLAQKFKDTHDWCKEHGLPESQCTLCNPDVRAKWEALRPKAGALRPGERRSVVTVERDGRQFTASENDPLCLVETSVIRFLDATIARQAGIEVTAVQPRRMSASIDVPAELEFDATRVTRITPLAAGIAREVRTVLGDEVQAGDVLAVLDSTALGEARSLFIERQQELRVAEAEYERIQALYRGTEKLLAAASMDASPTDIQNRLEGVPVGEARVRLLKAHAGLQLARLEAAREGKLFATKITSERDVQTARATLAAAEAEFWATREDIEFSRQKDRLAAERTVNVARAAFEAAERRLFILGLTAEQIAAADGAQKEKLSLYELRSPVSGRVVEQHVTAGESVNEEQPTFVVADPSKLWLIANVSERDAGILKVGASVRLLVDGLPGDAFQGRLRWISSEVDDRTRLVPVRAELDNGDGRLRARMFGRAEIALRDNADVLSVPAESIQTDGCCQLAFVREAPDRYVPRKLRLGANAGGFVEVLRGLREGEEVVTAGSFLMKTEILKSSIGAGCCEVETGR